VADYWAAVNRTVCRASHLCWTCCGPVDQTCMHIYSTGGCVLAPSALYTAHLSYWRLYALYTVLRLALPSVRPYVLSCPQRGQSTRGVLRGRPAFLIHKYIAACDLVHLLAGHNTATLGQLHRRYNCCIARGLHVSQPCESVGALLTLKKGLVEHSYSGGTWIGSRSQHWVGWACLRPHCNRTLSLSLLPEETGRM
jgi:hypothetical protein